MRWTKTLQTVDVHCEGEIGKVITSTTLNVPGATMLAKLVHLNTVDDSLRRLVCFEPRGFAQMTVNLLLPPTRPEAQAGFIVLQPDRAHPMSGSNAICVTTALLETGMIRMEEPQTILTLDTAAGLVTVTAACKDGKVTSAAINTSPSFVQDLDLEVETTEFGRIRIDVAYGGCFYGLIDVGQVGLTIEPANAARLTRAATSILTDLMARVAVQHPLLPQINQFSYVMFRDIQGDTVTTCTVLMPGRVDRSPCGTGSSANLAAMHARGLVKVGDVLTSRSIIGTTFKVELTGETTVGDRPAVLPRVTGRAWIYGMSQMGIDPTDPFPRGFALSDTWGPGVDQIL
jgi:proline racemase